MAFSRQRRPARGARPARPVRRDDTSRPALELDTDAAGRRSSAPKTQKQSDNGAAEFLFQHAVALAVSNAQLEGKLDAEHPHEILAPLDYADECRVKTDAVRSFWQVHGLLWSKSEIL